MGYRDGEAADSAVRVSGRVRRMLLPKENGVIGQKVRARGKDRFRALLNPKVLIGTVLGVILLALLLSVSDITTVWHIIQGFPVLIVPGVFALFVGRELFRSMQWRLFLNAIGIHATRREALFTLAGGDAAQILPGGLFFQDVLVSRELQAPVSAPLAATTLTIWLEITLAMLGLGALGLPGIPALRPIMAFCGLGSLLVLFLAHTRVLRGIRNLLGRLEPHLGRVGQKLVAGMETFMASFAGLSPPSVLLSGLVLCALYMALTIFGFYLICLGLKLPGIGVAQVTAIYALLIAVIDINPLPSDLGVSELSGVGGFLAFQVVAAAGLAAMLTFRILQLVAEELIAAVVFLFFRPERQRLFCPQEERLEADNEGEGNEHPTHGDTRGSGSSIPPDSAVLGGGEDG